MRSSILTKHKAARAFVAIAAAWLLMIQAGCGGGNNFTPVAAAPTPAPPGISAPPPLPAATAARFLEQSTFGPTPELMASVQTSGLQAFLDNQFAAPVSLYDEPAVKSSLAPVQARFVVNALNDQDQLRLRVAFALSEMFVISGDKINTADAFVPYLRLLQADAFGNFYDLLKDVTLNPAMGHYLDMVNNDKAPLDAKIGPNENYAREIMQLFSIGVSRLNIDGTLQIGSDGLPIPTYDQDTVEGLAHVFTGWTYPTMPGATPLRHNPPYYTGPMVIFESNHDTGSKLLLNGVTLPPGQASGKDLDDALHNIFNDPNVAPFIARQLIQHLVTSNPSPDYVKRVALVFNDNGSGVRGDLKAVVTAILLDAEARRDNAGQTLAADGHLKEPLLYMIGLLRALNAASDGKSVVSYSTAMLQPVLHPPSVFNFFPPNYQIQGTALLGPEFKIWDNSTAVARINFANALLYGSVGSGTKVDLTRLVALADNPGKLLDQLDAQLTHSQMSAAMRGAILTAISGISDPRRRTLAAIYLIVTSSQYQVQH